MNADELRALSAFAGELADIARDKAMHYFRSDVEIAIKSDATPVTRADREIESKLRSLIANRYPHHGFFGEESGGSIGAGLGWVIDPIDGTKSFICGVPLFGCLIALLADGKPVRYCSEIGERISRPVSFDDLSTSAPVEGWFGRESIFRSMEVSSRARSGRSQQ
ncbi:inositol monophosphatase family protein [Cupriavidus consociatus]|uniref:inositol monophosphatase family protein n=1 Tax=Cupriavidus consociatus TaxID=2821357 RepID=UPI0024E03154|nr:inositol monophosphatase family protein [Cupriavidus sp. LEh21]MDK2659034.1 inositol monophosphatase family protein [Cupriavidus sp. LEh21]